MLTIEERIARSKERTRQLEAQKKIKDKKEQDAKLQIDLRRNKIMGRILSECFPAVMQFQPGRSTADDEVNFALLRTILSQITEDKEYLSRHIEKAKIKLAAVEAATKVQQDCN